MVEELSHTKRYKAKEKLNALHGPEWKTALRKYCEIR